MFNEKVESEVNEVKCIVEFLKKYNKKTIDLYDLAYHIDNRPIINWSSTERKLFIDKLNELENSSILELKKSKRGEIQLDFIHRNIKINKWKLMSNVEIKDDFLYRKDIGIDSSYYLKNTDKYNLEKEYIKNIVDFLDENKQNLTLNEISYIIFKDEKALSQPQKSYVNGLNILKNLNLTIEDLNYCNVIAPFYYHLNKYGNTVLIVENKDTCYSLFRILYKTQTNIKGVIYGEGRAILKKFKFLDVYNLNSDIKFLYYGDIDQEGFDIFRSLLQKYPDYNIHLSKILYQELLNYESRLLKNKRKLDKLELSTLIEKLSEEEQNKIIKIIEEDRYIPQEALNFEKMKVLLNGLQNRLY
ncbi:Wadjet anti-phage system protein JetD domain-containing protein [Tepidibacter aestuarii]|uniref:Wadjet anti-phage system protein JetD domain-containing protein n=1 Tax=Tepidibacter aestuarii TaxID=2925782 RepID=UPI0020C0AE81|nr:Wadjet anti-phage system protein JetD domain-containing protein [Tepidibacter aestuarii]CAH2213889.1 DUF2220 domain-containing protein [Tepidibacter aestuarii]